MIELPTDGDLRFKESVEIVEGTFSSVFWSCLQLLESVVPVVPIAGD